MPVIIKVGTKRNAKRGRDEAFEYVISSTDGKIVKYGKEQAIALFKKLGLANGRVVQREGITPYVSAIKNKYESYSMDKPKLVSKVNNQTTDVSNSRKEDSFNGG